MVLYPAPKESKKKSTKNEKKKKHRNANYFLLIFSTHGTVTEKINKK